jgi:hypothetical protein
VAGVGPGVPGHDGRIYSTRKLDFFGMFPVCRKKIFKSSAVGDRSLQETSVKYHNLQLRGGKSAEVASAKVLHDCKNKGRERTFDDVVVQRCFSVDSLNCLTRPKSEESSIHAHERKSCAKGTSIYISLK